MSGGQRLLLAAILPAILLFVPIAVDQAAEPREPSESAASSEPTEPSGRDAASEISDAAAAKRIQQEILEIERRQHELQIELELLAQRRAEITGEDRDAAVIEELAWLEDKITSLERTGRYEEADALRERFAQRDDLMRREGDLERAYARELYRSASVEARIRGLQLGAEELTRAGDTRGAEEMRLEARQLKEELAAIAYETAAREMEMNAEIQGQARLEYEKARQLAIEEARAAEYDEQALKTRQLEAELQYRKALDLERRIDELRSEAKAAEDRGDAELAQKLAQKARELQEKLSY